MLPLSLAQLRWRPRVGAWSIIECLDHLNRLYAYYLPRIQQALEQNGDAGLGSALPEAEAAFVAQLATPSRIALYSPPVLAPDPAADPERAADQFLQLRDRYRQAIEAASHAGREGVLIADSLHLPVQSLAGTIILLAAYDHRLLWQAEQVIHTPGFPISFGD